MVYSDADEALKGHLGKLSFNYMGRIYILLSFGQQTIWAKDDWLTLGFD